MSADIPLRDICISTQSVYQRQAEVWHRGRARNLYEQVWLDPFVTAVPEGGRILDLGCGSGEPIARYLLDRGCSVVGIDYAPQMIEIAQQNLPQADWHVLDMRHLPNLGRFDGILSWDGFFHLSIDEQRVCLPKLAQLLEPGGAIMLTVGPNEGEVTGTVGDEPVYHASLSPGEYRKILEQAGFSNVTFQPNDTKAKGRSVLFATDLQPRHPANSSS